MEIVISDLKKYLKRHRFPSKTVLIFPPFNGFRRFLIHKLIEDNFTSAEVAAFSIGKDIHRRIVVCYKGLVRTEQNKGTASQQAIKSNMIEADGQSRQKNSPTVAVYRPPAARIAETKQNIAETKTDLVKRSRTRRPDQQMYVPRAKRTPFPEEQPRSRSRSSSRTCVEHETCDKRRSFSKHSDGETISPDAVNQPSNMKTLEKSVTKNTSHSPEIKYIKSSCLKTNGNSPVSKKHNNLKEDNATDINTIDVCPNQSLDSTLEDSCKSIISNIEISQDQKSSDKEIKIKLPRELISDKTAETSDAINTVRDITHEHKIGNDEKISVDEINMKIKEEDCRQNRINETMVKTTDHEYSCDSSENDSIHLVKKVDSNNPEFMEIIALSSDSNESTSTNVSDIKDISSTNKSTENEKSSDTMEIEQNSNSRNKKVHRKTKGKNEDRNLKNKIRHDSAVSSDILIISDTSSSSDEVSCSTPQEPTNSKPVNVDRSKKTLKEKDVIPPKRNKIVNPEECDWESLYDDSGECLVPDLMEELTNSVGKVRIETAGSDYRSYQSIEERSNDGECVIEIYDFPPEFKTSDLINIFAAYRSKNFQIKWVDDTHALGVFASPLMADEVLACTLPFVKTRPLRMGIVESRVKARNLVLPPLPSMERPKTCTALARRLVTGALGLRLPTSSQDREKEKQVLKEAREKRRLEAKQREAAWDGTLTNSGCV